MQASSSSDDDSDSDDNESEEEQDEIGSEEDETLLPLEQRLKRNDRKGGLVRKVKPKIENKKKSKHAPTEASSKRRAYFDLNANGNSISLATYKPRDPRISSLSGHLTEDKFEDDYQFVEDIRQKEIKTIKERVQAHKMTGRKGRTQRKRLGMTQEYSVQDDTELLQRLQMESRNLERRQMERVAQKTVKRDFGPNFKPKQRDLKEALRTARLDELRKRKGEGAVQKSLAKRRKREKSKDANMKIK